MEISSHHSRLLHQLNEQRRQDLFCDCHILIQGRTFKAHRNVLFASSGYFKMLLSQTSKETCQPTTATFEVFSPETFHVILDFMYTGNLALNGQTVIEVMSAASYLQMTDVIGACKTFINSSLDINEKEQAGFSPLSNLDKSSNGYRQPNLYNADWRTGASPSRHQPTPDPGDFLVSSSSWGHHSSQPPSQMDIQEQQPHLGQHVRKWGILRKPRQQLGRSHIPDTRIGKSLIATDDPGSSRDPATVGVSSPAGVIIEIVEDEEPTQPSSLHGQEVKHESVSLKEHILPKPKHLMDTDPYSGVVGIMEGYGEDGLPRIRFKCPHCPHTVKRRADLKRHLRCHTGERPFPCPACGKGFTRLEHLRGHFQTIHEACKLVCRKCKRPVTEETGRVVQHGTRRYRLCHGCLSDAADDIVPVDANKEWTHSSASDEKVSMWLLGQEHGAAPEMEEDDESSDLIIHEVRDSDDDIEETEVKPDINKL
ncbi:zinc finger and BTB domain-containing protein 8A-like [Pleurodeles waltl]|uniref:zinc finger and BTB domain-containing protein 8A-like n=1 Tax=Pleurodeles waltl TaxID=8319 RepID=UPI00370939E3